MAMPRSDCRRLVQRAVIASVRTTAILTISGLVSMQNPARAVVPVSPVWDGSVGDWFDSSHWSPTSIPNNNSSNSYNPSINSGTVTLGSSIITDNLTLGTQTLLSILSNNTYTIVNGFNTAGEMDLQTGALLQAANATLNNGAVISSTGGTVNVTGILTILGAATASQLTFNSVNGGGTLDLAGLNLWNSGSVTSGTTLHVLASATLNGGSSIFLLSSTLINEGSVDLKNSVVQVNSASFLDNRGTLVLPNLPNWTMPVGNSGVMTANGDPTFAGTFTNSGTFSIPSPHHAVTFSGGGSGSGATFSVGASSTITFTAPSTSAYTLNNCTLSGAGVFRGNIIIQGSNTATNVAFSFIGGAGRLDIAGAASFSGHISGGADVRVLPGGTMTLSNAPILDGSSLTNEGIAPAFNSGISFFNGSSFLNSGIMTTSGFDVLSGVTGGTFTNSGTINATASIDVGATSPLANFTNSGFMQLKGGFISLPFVNTGEVITSGSLVLPHGGTISGFATTTGTGSFFFVGGVLDNAVLQGQNFGGTVTLQHASTAQNASFDRMLGNGSLTVSQNLSFPSTPTFSFLNGTHIIVLPTGTFSVATSSSNINLGSSTLTLQGNTDFHTVTKGLTFNFTAGSSVINNGTFYTYATNVTFDTDNHTANAFYNTGTFGRAAVITTSTTTTTFHIPFHNSGGIVDVQQGFIDFAGGFYDDTGNPNISTDFQFAPGAGLAFSGGNYDFGNGPLNLGAGTLKGTGTIHAGGITAGGVSPGNSPGMLTVNTDLTLAPGADLNFEIGGPTQGTGYDFLDVNGTLNLDGILTVTLVNGFVPDAGEGFAIISAQNINGTLANAPEGTRLADAAGTGTFLVHYNTFGQPGSPGGGSEFELLDFQPVPEPSTCIFVLPASAALLMRRRRKLHSANKH